MSQCLKGSAGQVLSAYGQAGRTAPRFVYQPILSKENAPKTTSIALSSSHTEHVKVPKGWEGWQSWKSWKDVPDSLIPKTSPRDPDNLIYSHPTYINLRKQQIWFQIPDGKLVWQKMPMDMYLYYFVICTLMFTISWSAYLHYQEIYKKYYPD